MKLPDIIKQAARDLRKNMTPAEKIMWDEIRRGKIKGKEFQKQKPIFLYFEDNNFPRYIIADFVCLKDKLIIEIDGSVHSIPEILALDKEKQLLLEKRGYRLLRFTNEQVIGDVKNIAKIIQENL